MVHEGMERGPYQYSYEYLVIFQVGSGSLHGQVGGQTDNSSDIFYYLFYSNTGAQTASIERLEGDPYHYSYGNIEYM